MKKINSSQNVIAMSPDNKPAERARSGETVVFETIDAFNGQITSEKTLFSAVGWDRVNPATGPLYIEGAEPGDCLKVTILDIVCNEKAVMILAPGFGVLDTSREQSFVYNIQDGFFVFDDNLKLPIKPMIGVIGTAPANESIPTGTPGTHGGNMDTSRITRGAVLYLPVNVPGALLAMGDLHAVMGDGEVAVCGAEVGGTVTVRVDVLKGMAQLTPALPLLVEGGQLITIASAKTLDEAAIQASRNMHWFLTECVRLDKDRAALILSLAGNLRVCQIVDPLMTARMELDQCIAEKYGKINL